MTEIADIEPAESQDISEIRRNALALLERCGGTSDEEIDYDDGEEGSDFSDEDKNKEEETLSPEMKAIRSNDLMSPRNSRRQNAKDDDDDEEQGRSPRRKRNGDTMSTDDYVDTDDDDEQSYGDEELDPLVKAVRELSYSLETDMVERQDSALTDDNSGNSSSICCCCNCCCCQQWSRRTQCLVVWILVILGLAVSYYLFLTQYPHMKRKHDGGV